MDVKQAKIVVTAFYFSVLYYASEAWFHRHLGFHLKQKIRSAHYRALRTIFGKTHSRETLDSVSERASPDEWSQYALAKMFAGIINAKAPVRLLESINANSYTERRQPGRMFVFDRSFKKIGRQSINNRLNAVSKQMKFSWMNMNKDCLRTNLKKSFFKYYKVMQVNK